MYFSSVWISAALLKFVAKVILLFLQLVPVESFYKQQDYYYAPDLPAIEFEHMPHMYTTELPRDLNGTDDKIMDPIYTPDFRIEEPPYNRYRDKFFREEQRPYRISPHKKQMKRHYYDSDWEMAGCTCTTVYKRLKLLGSCAVVTTRHILTTATTTELVLRRYRHFKYLRDILGFWYDTSKNMYNSSIYSDVARIHYHPKYLRPKLVNRSHPIPAVFDLSLWAASYKFQWTFLGGSVVICPRGGSHKFEFSSPIPTSAKRDYMCLVAGFQFIRAFDRIPMPFFKYLVATKNYNVIPCPKTEWGWFHCIRANWAKLGMDSGATFFRHLRSGWRYSGLIAMHAVSMRLRSLDMILYFQVLENHPVLEFMYDSMMGYFKYEWLDHRFYDSVGRSPKPKNDSMIFVQHILGEEFYEYGGVLPNY